MAESEIEFQRRQRAARFQQTVVVGLSLLLMFLLLACLLSVVAVHQRFIPPPAFAVSLGPMVLAAPCPPQMSVCDESTPFYAVWQGVKLPNGKIRYHYLFFIYLAPERPARRP